MTNIYWDVFFKNLRFQDYVIKSAHPWKGVTHKHFRYGLFCNYFDDKCVIGVNIQPQKLINQHPFFALMCYCLIFSHLPSDCSYIWPSGCDLEITQNVIPLCSVRGEACCRILLLFYSVGVCVQVGADLSGYCVTHRVESTSDCIADKSCGKFTLVNGHQREPGREWFIPGIFPGSRCGSSEREKEWVSACVCVCAFASKLSKIFQFECIASAMFISHSFSISLSGSQCLFISIQWILARSWRRRRKTVRTDSGKRWRVDVGGQVQLPDILLDRGLVGYLFS